MSSIGVSVGPRSSASSESDEDWPRGAADGQPAPGGAGEDGAISPLPQESAASPPPLRPLTPRSPRLRQRTRSYTEMSKMKTTDDALPMYRVPGNNRRTIYTAGRPPWYGADGQMVEPFIIGICGGTASGKTTVARKIIEALDVQWVTLLSMDSFYKILDDKQHELAAVNEYDFDHPDSFDFELLLSTISRLKDGKKADVPIYNFVTHKRENTTKTIYGANVIIFEGIMAFYNKRVLDMLDMKVFVDTDSDVRLARRLSRDVKERGRSVDGVIQQYDRFVKPAFDHYIQPSMVHADIIVPRGGENAIAINLIVQHVTAQLQTRGLRLREKLAKGHYQLAQEPRTLHLLPSTHQIQGLHTFIRDRNTQRDEFIFYSKRLMRLTIEHALSLLPFREAAVDTPQGQPYAGLRLDSGSVCGVSILRAGETMEQALCEVCKDVRIGKMLIQTNHETDEPELYYLRLPRDIKEYYVFLMDATVATGAAAMMALRVLLDHDVPEDRIFLCSLLMARSGVHNIAYAFPKVRIITSAVDPDVNDMFYVIPGIGNFGDRFFGTEAKA